MDKFTTLPPDDSRRPRADGAQTRERLLLSAMRLFAEQGYAKTSTREIALAAGTNIASISYHFGDKAGLYRAAFSEPLPHQQHADCFMHPDLPLDQALRGFYTALLGPLKQGDVARLCMRLWFREMLEPTGVWHEEIDRDIRPAHAALTQLLSNHLGEGSDAEDVSRLAFCLVGLAVQLMVTREVVDKVHPQLLDGDAAVDIWIERLCYYAEAMIAAEQARVRANASAAAAVPEVPSPSTTTQPRKKKA
ncbi:MAG: CerR family C-terminal domain-containing protein [Gammaproteobacteria bacterium]